MRRARLEFAPKHHAGSGLNRITLLHRGLAPPGRDGTGLGASMCHSDVITSMDRSCLRRIHKVDYALEVVDGPELDHDLALAFAETDRHPGIER